MLVPLLSVIGFAVGAEVGEYDLFARGEMADLLLAINDHIELYALSLSAQVVIDAIWLPLAAGMLYLLFRDRDQTFALVGTLGLLLGAALFLAHDSAVMTVGWLATDFAEGGAGSVPAAADSTLQVARAVAIFEGVVALCALTVTGLGLASFGVLLARAPGGILNPPRWLGLVAIVGGVCYLATWTFLLDHTVGGIVTLLGELATMIALAGLGVWLFRHADEPQLMREPTLAV